MESCELLLSSYFILYVKRSLYPKHRNILNNLKESLRNLSNLFFLEIKNTLKFSSEFYLPSLFSRHLEGVWHI